MKPVPPPHKPRLEGMRAFYIVWAGQFFSIFTSEMTAFVITLWAWQLTGSATALVLVGVASFVPRTLLSPFAGTLVDRWDRKWVMVLSDGGAALATAYLLVMFITGQAEIWHLYLAGAFAGAFRAFQYPATSAAITTLVPQDRLTRANSMVSLITSASGVGAPLLAGGLIALLDVGGILVIDLVTFFFALATLLMVHIPRPEMTPEGETGRGSVWHETVQGARYIMARASLVSIFLLFMVSNIAAGFVFPMLNPMVLARTGNDAASLGLVRSAGSFGFMAGGLLLTLWKGPKKRILGVNLGFIAEGLFGALLLGAGRSLTPWMIGFFMLGVANTVINSLYIAILQAKVAPDIQGRIFGLEFLTSTVSYPIGQLAAGLAADTWLEPAMLPGGSLAQIFNGLVGVGPGAGLGLIIITGGLISIVVGLVGFLIRPVRDIEDLLPDYHPDPAPETAASS